MVNGLHAENVYKFYLVSLFVALENIWSSGGCITMRVPNAANSVEIFISFIYYYFAFYGFLLFFCA